MTFIKRYKFVFFIGIGITIFYIFTRLYNILELPIFTDEAIYTRWAQIAKNDANWRFISLTDGKQPLLIWLMMVAMKVVEDPLLASRLVSVVAGLFTLIGLYFLGMELFKSRWVGIASSILYLLFPMAFVYDRMALYDSLVGTFAVWSLYFEILLVRRLRLDIALILGMVIGGGILTKTSGFFSIYLLPVSLLLFDFRHKDKYKRLMKWMILALVSVILSYIFYSILRLSPFFHIINEKNALFVYPLKEWITHPFTYFIGNWKAIWDWLTTYTTWPFLLLIVGSFFITKKHFFGKLILVIWFIFPAVSLALFGRTLYPRFVFFMILPLLPLAALTIFTINRWIKNRLLLVACCLLFIIPALRSDYLILTDFSSAPIPYSDVSQYNNDWPAGTGVKEAVKFFKEKAKNNKIYIGTQGTFGLMPYALEIYLIDNPNIRIEGFWPIGDRVPEKVMEESKKVPTYFVFYQPCQSCKVTGFAPLAWNSIDIIYQYKRVYGNYFSVYRVMP